jgi:hypothetical protein
MKFHFNRAVALALVSSTFLLVAAGCKKSNSGNSGTGMSATVAGTSWASTFPIVAFYTNTGGVFDIAGGQFKNGDTTEFDLEFASPITLNKAVNSDTSAFIAVYTDTKTQAEYAVLPGSFGHAILTITSYDSTGHKIGGTFNGILYDTATLTDSIAVTNGSFSTSFQAQ